MKSISLLLLPIGQSSLNQSPLLSLRLTLIMDHVRFINESLKRCYITNVLGVLSRQEDLVLIKCDSGFDRSAPARIGVKLGETGAGPMGLKSFLIFPTAITLWSTRPSGNYQTNPEGIALTELRGLW